MEAQYNINMLKGCQLVDIGRCADLIWWIFSKGDNEYSLHTQCACRVKQGKKIILTRSSIYYYEDEDAADAGDQKRMLFDYQLRQTILCLLPITITQIRESSTHDIIIEATNNIQIEIFADNPNDYEQWRLFTKENPSPHLVAYNDRIAYE